MGAAESHATERVGRYEVAGRLATGGMAEILLGRLVGPSGFERPLVIKRILPHLAEQQSFVSMFLDEARLAAQIRHPNVVSVSELGQEGDEATIDVIDQDGKISQEEKEGQRAVTASNDNTVIVWDTRIPKDSDTELPEASQVLTLKRHNRPVHAVRFSPNGRYILTGSQDHRAIVWPTENWLTEKRKAYLDLKKKKNSEGVDKPALTLSTGLLTD